MTGVVSLTHSLWQTTRLVSLNYCLRLILVGWALHCLLFVNTSLDGEDYDFII
jgi:hypothetical protein